MSKRGILWAEIKTTKFKFKHEQGRITQEEEITLMMHRVARHWLRAALHAVQGTFPVQTGMARASFINLAEYLNSQPGQRVAFDPLANINYFKVIPGVKSVTQGRLQSKSSSFITILRNQYGAFSYRFEWWTNVEHFLRNETDPEAKRIFHLIYPTPWNVMGTANAAAEAYLNKILKTAHRRMIRDFKIVKDKL